MKNEYAAVIMANECPTCGATNSVQYRLNEMAVDAACGFCGSMVRWRRKVPVAGHDPNGGKG